jgi:hypothetical protein
VLRMARKPKNGETEQPAAAPAEETEGALQPHPGADAGAVAPAAPAEASDSPAGSPPQSTGGEPDGDGAPTSAAPSDPQPQEPPSEPVPAERPSGDISTATQSIAEEDAIDTSPMTDAFEAARQVAPRPTKANAFLQAFRVVRVLLASYDPAAPAMDIDHIPSWVRDIIDGVLKEFDDIDILIASDAELRAAYARHYQRVDERDWGKRS